ncbi:MAG TPA: hypothetical protein VEJ43_02805 [Pseudolabrys sp.]|nr:hypothetical protein [Pseudolabrys sp.]
MTSVISPSAINLSALFAGSATPNWLADAQTAIANQANEGGLLGMLDSASSNDGSINSFLGSSSNTANAFALISQNSVTSASTLYAQIASQNAQNAAQQKLQDVIDAATAAQQMVQPKNMLDPFIYFPDGSSIDTNNNILTMADGTQIDTTTGAKVIDTSSIMQLANGAYLDTKNNIMTMPDGTQIDTITGLKISVTA